MKKRFLVLLVILSIALSLWPPCALGAASSRPYVELHNGYRWAAMDEELGYGSVALYHYNEDGSRTELENPWPMGNEYDGYILLDGTLALYFYNGEATGTLTIPEEIDGRKVTALYIFCGFVSYDSQVTEIVLPSTLTDIMINDGAYFPDLPSSLSDPHEIKVSFSSTPPGMAIVDDCLYRISDHTLLTCLSFPKGGSITVKEGTEHIAGDAFAGREDLEAIVLPEGLQTIGAWAFNGCWGLTSLNLPNTLEYAGDGCFEVTSLTELVLPEGMKEIGQGLIGSSQITKVSLPASLEEIGPQALFNYRTVDVKLSPKNPNYQLKGDMLIDTRTNKLHTLLNGEKVKKVTIPKTIEIIGENAFTYCTKLTKLTIPDSVREIESNAFFTCGVLCEITIGSGVERMGRGAIMYCGDAYAAKHELTLYVKAGSVAEAYAKENGIAYKIK